MHRFKPLVFWFIQALFVFLILEGISYFFLKTSSNPLFRARRILQRNDSWGWQASPDLNTTFENSPVYTDTNGFRTEKPHEQIDLQQVELLTLGPSSAFGWGVPANDTYTALIAKKLGVSYLNASQIGFSTEQGLLLWELFLKNKLPKLKYVIVSYGVNDLDRFRFFDLSFVDDLTYFRQHSENPGGSQPSVNLNFLTVFDLLKSETSLKYNCDPLKAINQRLSLPDFENETIRLLNFLKQKNLKIVLLGTPYLNTPPKPDFDYESVAKYYRQAEAAAAAGDCEKALNYIADAKTMEPWRVQRDVERLSEIQNLIAKTHEVAFIDLYADFSSLESQRKYFVDPVHPSAIGHELIAQRVLQNLLPNN